MSSYSDVDGGNLIHVDFGLRATHALLREMVDSIVSHSIIERYFFVDTDVFHCNEIMCASFIYSDTTIGAAGMINLTWGSGLES